MRQLFVSVPREAQSQVDKAATQVEAVNVCRLEGHSSDEALAVTMLHVSNSRIGEFIQAAGDVPELQVSFLPSGSIPLRPPSDEAPQQVRDVEMRSPLEVLLSGFQSIGSWIGLLGYAVAAGVVVWLGLFTNTMYLLTASMLIAPFAGPAMNSALATASGEIDLLRQGLLRYGGALGTSILTCAALTVVAGPTEPTSLMLDQAHVSVYAFLLPLVAGAAGALNLIQSDRDSLVTAAGAGVLVAASLAPPAGLVGMAGALEQWSLAANGLYLLVLQLAGINLAGFLVFRLGGLSTRHARYQHGKVTAVIGSILASLFLLMGLVTWQTTGPTELRLGTVAEEARAEIVQLLRDEPNTQPVAVEASFSQLDGEPRVLLVQAHARTVAGDLSPNQLTELLQTHLAEQWPEITPLVDLQILNER